MQRIANLISGNTVRQSNDEHAQGGTLQPGNAGAGPSNTARPFAALRRAVGAGRSGAIAAPPGKQAMPYQQQLEEWERSAPAGEEAGRRQAVERIQRFRPKFLETTTLDLSRLGLTTVPPLPKKIESLDLSNNNLTSLPELPKRLISLTAANCRLTTLGALPPKLRGLNINHNYLGTLPTLPETLTWLNADYNFLEPRPTLPYKLRHCHFAHNLENECNHDASLAPYVGRLIQWVENAPADETESRRRAIGKIIRACDPSGSFSLDLAGMSLTTLPDLPAGLRSLSASGNQLTALPELPAGLIGLYADNNLLTTLPALPAGLLGLHANNNRLTILPEIPIRLVSLSVSLNPLVAPPAAEVGVDAANTAEIARRWQQENRARAAAQACLPPLRQRPSPPLQPSPPLPIDPNAACSVPKDPPEWLYQRVGNWLWSYYTGNQFDALAPAKKIDHVMHAVSGLNAGQSERASDEKFQLGHRNLSAREALAYALEIAIESKPSAVPAISRRMLQLHPQQPDTFPLFGIDFTRKRIAEWAHNLNLPGQNQPAPLPNRRVAATDVAVERTMHASDGQNVHSSAVRNQMNAQLQLMKNAIRGTSISKDLAFTEIAGCLQRDYNARSAFNRKFGPNGALSNTAIADDLIVLWNYIRSRSKQTLRQQLEASLIAKFREIEVEGPCSVGIHQRILDVPTAIDWTLEPPPSADQLREELQRLAARISEEWDDNTDQIQHFVHSEISEGHAAGNPEHILSELKRDRFMQTADIEFRLLRGLPGALVKAEAERVFPAGLII